MSLGSINVKDNLIECVGVQMEAGKNITCPAADRINPSLAVSVMAFNLSPVPNITCNLNN